MSATSVDELARRGWQLTRDGSIATAIYTWDDPADPESGWQLVVVYTSGHGARFSLSADGDGLTERSLAEAGRLHEALTDALWLLEWWRGELPGEGG